MIQGMKPGYNDTKISMDLQKEKSIKYSIGIVCHYSGDISTRINTERQRQRHTDRETFFAPSLRLNPRIPQATVLHQN